MPTDPRTDEVNLIFNQHCIDKELSAHEAYTLSLKEPKEVKKEVKGLAKFDALDLKNSLRSVRNRTRAAWKASTSQQGEAKSPGPLFGRAPRQANDSSSAMDSNSFTPTPTKKRKGNTSPFALPSTSTQYVASASSGGYADGGMDQLESMSSLSISDPFDNFKFMTYQDIISEPKTSFAVMLSENPKYYREQIRKALTNDRKGVIFFTKECAGAENLLASIENIADREDEAHDHVIAVNDKKVMDLEAQLEDAKNHGQFLARRKKMATGKARAFLHIVRKCLGNIEAATLTDDQEDLDAMQQHHKEWEAEVVEMQNLMNDGAEEAIEVILGKMKMMEDEDERME